MSEIQSTNEAIEPSLNEGSEGAEEDVNDSSIDSDDGEEMTGAEAVEIEKKAKESGKTIQEFLKDRKANKKPEPSAKPAPKAAIPQVKDKAEEPAPKAKEAKEAEVNDTAKYKVKVNGEEKEVDVKELMRGYSLAEGSRKVLQEGLNARKQAEEFVKLMKDPDRLWSALEKLGHDPLKLAEEHLVRRAEEEMLTPEEIDTRNKLKKLKTYEEMELAQKREEEQRRHNEQKEIWAKDFETKFTDALRKVAIPPTKGAISRVAKKIHAAAKVGLELSPLDAAARVKREIEEEHQYLYGEADDETLYKLVGDKNSERILKHRAKQIRNSTNYNNAPSNSGNKSSHKPTGYSWSDWNQEKYKK